jgi:hypothetical protein
VAHSCNPNYFGHRDGMIVIRGQTGQSISHLQKKAYSKMDWRSFGSSGKVPVLQA